MSGIFNTAADAAISKGNLRQNHQMFGRLTDLLDWIGFLSGCFIFAAYKCLKRRPGAGVKNCAPESAHPVLYRPLPAG